MPVAFIVISLFLVSPADVVVPYDTVYEAVPRDKYSGQTWFQDMVTRRRCADLQDQWTAAVDSYYGDMGIRGAVSCSYERSKEALNP